MFQQLWSLNARYSTKSDLEGRVSRVSVRPRQERVHHHLRRVECSEHPHISFLIHNTTHLQHKPSKQNGHHHGRPHRRRPRKPTPTPRQPFHNVFTKPPPPAQPPKQQPESPAQPTSPPSSRAQTHASTPPTPSPAHPQKGPSQLSRAALVGSECRWKPTRRSPPARRPCQPGSGFAIRRGRWMLSWG